MISANKTITPALKKRIEEAEKACLEGRCVTCKSKEELNSFLDSLDDTAIMSEAELKSIYRGLEDIKAGRIHFMDSSESLDSFLDRIQDEG